MSTSVAADLRVEFTSPEGTRLQGHLTGSGNRLRLRVDDPGVFAGPQDASVIRALAKGLAARGVVVEVFDERGLLICIGRVRTSWWQRRLTGSRHIRLGSVRGAWTSARARATASDAMLPSSAALPPVTLWPMAPTFARRDRRPVGTTHDPARGGGPRLVVEKAHLWGGERQPVYWLEHPVTTIGSDPACDIRLDGLAAHHASVRHGGDDEFVVEVLHPATRVHGASVAGRAVLRTGARLEVGEHVLAFFREEFADHGRPHGGRVGGELGRQLPQRRPDAVRADAD
ncbi:hypothetical protein BH11ACT8_BH11ACT8_10560 [soil metagenome]